MSGLVSYRARLEPLQAFLTTWQSDTLFGALCWALRDLIGVQALNSLLAAYSDNPVPLVVSNAFSGDLLPKPLAMQPRYVAAGTWSERLQRAYHAKEQKRVTYLSIEEFEQFRQGLVPTVKPRRSPILEADTLHNMIDRRTQTVGESGSLYEITEQFLDRSRYRYFSLYLKVRQDWVDAVYGSLELLGTIGIGKRKSLGYGRFRVLDFEEFRFPEYDLPVRGFVSLSNYVPAEGDPFQGSWRLVVKDGKLDGQWGLKYSHRKRPLLMLQAGACFETDSVREWYGRLVRGVHPERPEVVQYGLAYPVPYYRPV